MDLFDMISDKDKDTPIVRSIELENNKLNMTRTDPYGFVHISLDRGQIPEWMRGVYTSFSEAEKAARKWIAEKNKTEKLVKV